MGQPAARFGDRLEAVDVHIQVLNGVPAATAVPFIGQIAGGTSGNVRIGGQPAAMAGSTATNLVPHVPTPGAAFQRPPTNIGRVAGGSATVRINSRPAARHGDAAVTCNDPVDAPVGSVVASGNVRIG